MTYQRFFCNLFLIGFYTSDRLQIIVSFFLDSTLHDVVLNPLCRKTDLAFTRNPLYRHPKKSSVFRASIVLPDEQFLLLNNPCIMSFPLVYKCVSGSSCYQM